MKVKDLIKQLQAMPPNCHVRIVYDGEPRLDCEVVYQSRQGFIVLTDKEQVVYSTYSRPKTAPTSSKDRYWETK